MPRQLSLSFLCLGLLAGCSASSAQPSAASRLLPSLFVSGALGDACVVNEDCNAGFCDRSLPGGYCSMPCEGDASCPEEGVCFEGFCQKPCVSFRACRDSTQTCYFIDDTAGFCSFDYEQVPSSPNIGAPCTAALECSVPEGLAPYCLPEFSLSGTETGTPGGMCFALGCNDDASCGVGAKCVEQGNTRFCALGCASDSECRDGFQCEPSAGICSNVQ